RRNDPTPRSDILSILIDARDDQSRGMTDDELVGQAAVLFGASYETTASALTWVFFLLERHPNVVNKLSEELDSVLNGAAPTVDQISNLPYAQACIKESMRLLPTVPFAIRAAVSDCELGGLEVPHGSRIVCSHFLTHRDGDVFKNPNRFDPDRWS